MVDFFQFNEGKCISCGSDCYGEEFCFICGIEQVNYCSGVHIKNMEKYITTPCDGEIDFEARYCSLCGARSTFYDNKFIGTWNSKETQKSLKYKSPYKLLPRRHSAIEGFEIHLQDEEVSTAIRMDKYLHSVMYPAYWLLTENVKDNDMKKLTHHATKLTTLLLKSYITPSNENEEFYNSSNYPLKNYETQMKVRKILDLALEQIDLIAPDDSKNNVKTEF
jgi:hypothetical protein